MVVLFEDVPVADFTGYSETGTLAEIAGGYNLIRDSYSWNINGVGQTSFHQNLHQTDTGTGTDSPAYEGNTENFFSGSSDPWNWFQTGSGSHSFSNSVQTINGSNAYSSSRSTTVDYATDSVYPYVSWTMTSAYTNFDTSTYLDHRSSTDFTASNSVLNTGSTSFTGTGLVGGIGGVGWWQETVVTGSYSAALGGDTTTNVPTTIFVITGVGGSTAYTSYASTTNTFTATTTTMSKMSAEPHYGLDTAAIPTEVHITWTAEDDVTHREWLWAFNHGAAVSDLNGSYRFTDIYSDVTPMITGGGNFTGSSVLPNFYWGGGGSTPTQTITGSTLIVSSTSSAGDTISFDTSSSVMTIYDDFAQLPVGSRTQETYWQTTAATTFEDWGPDTSISTTTFTAFSSKTIAQYMGISTSSIGSLAYWVNSDQGYDFTTFVRTGWYLTDKQTLTTGDNNVLLIFQDAFITADGGRSVTYLSSDLQGAQFFLSGISQDGFRMRYPQGFAIQPNVSGDGPVYPGAGANIEIPYGTQYYALAFANKTGGPAGLSTELIRVPIGVQYGSSTIASGGLTYSYSWDSQGSPVMTITTNNGVSASTFTNGLYGIGSPMDRIVDLGGITYTEGGRKRRFGGAVGDATDAKTYFMYYGVYSVTDSDGGVYETTFSDFESFTMAPDDVSVLENFDTYLVSAVLTNSAGPYVNNYSMHPQSFDTA